MKRRTSQDTGLELFKTLCLALVDVIVAVLLQERLRHGVSARGSQKPRNVKRSEVELILLVVVLFLPQTTDDKTIFIKLTDIPKNSLLSMLFVFFFSIL